MTLPLTYGVVTRVDPATRRPYVRATRRTGSHEHGPCPIIEGPWSYGLTTETGGDGHVHGLGVDLTAGDTVIVGFLDDGSVVVLGRVR